MSTKSNKIAVVMRLEHQCGRIRSVLRKYGYRYPVLSLGNREENSDSVLAALREAGTKVIITGRSIPAGIVNQLNLLHTPITRSRLTFIRVIERALRDNERAAIILGNGIYYDMAKEVIPAYGEQVLLYKYHSADEIPGLIDQALALGTTAFIGAASLIHAAEERHLLAMEIPFEEDDILFAVKTAEYNLQVLENQLESNELLQAVWNNIPSGIVVFDQNNMVSGANDTAIHILGCRCEELIGCPCKDTPLGEFLRHSLHRSEETDSQVTELNGTIYAVTCRPIQVDGVHKFTLVLIEPIQQIQKMEQKIRHKLYHKGNMATVTFPNIVGNSAAIKQTIRDAKRYAAVDSSILIYGETGTGKEMFVQSIHNQSPRQNYPFVAINCGALPESLLESLLFGYEKGAFTGAVQSKRGLFEIAHQGTIFLDEIGEMPLQTQARFLRVLQEKEVMPIGSDRVIPVDVRVIAATHRNLPQMVREGTFRADLYYRISVLNLAIPPLRERPEDIIALAQYRVLTMRGSLNEKVTGISGDALNYLAGQPLEGNVRQLFNIVERAIILSDEAVISLETIRRSASVFYPGAEAEAAAPPIATPPADSRQSGVLTGNDFPPAAAVLPEAAATSQARAEAIRNALTACGGRRKQAAEKLGVSSSTLYRRMKELHIS